MKRTSQYSADYNAEKKVAILDLLVRTGEAMSIDKMKSSDFALTDMTIQKMSRLLNELVEMGLVAKGKNYQTGRNIYKAISAMKEQGYEIQENCGYEYKGEEQ